jgi:hypothetical protein
MKTCIHQTIDTSLKRTQWVWDVIRILLFTRNLWKEMTDGRWLGAQGL